MPSLLVAAPVHTLSVEVSSSAKEGLTDINAYWKTLYKFFRS